MKKIILNKQGKNKGKYFALVDDEDYEKVSNYNWYYDRGYASNNLIRKMHTFLMGYPKGMVVDHINHNKLDNRHSNLRICTHQQNQHNQKKCVRGSSTYKGIYWDKRKDKWAVQIQFNNKQYWIGYFDKELWAAMAYDINAKILFGQYAGLNFS